MPQCLNLLIRFHPRVNPSKTTQRGWCSLPEIFSKMQWWVHGNVYAKSVWRSSSQLSRPMCCICLFIVGTTIRLIVLYYSVQAAGWFQCLFIAYICLYKEVSSQQTCWKCAVCHDGYNSYVFLLHHGWSCFKLSENVNVGVTHTNESKWHVQSNRTSNILTSLKHGAVS